MNYTKKYLKYKKKYLDLKNSQSGGDVNKELITAVEEAIKNGTDVNVTFPNGDTPLHIAVKKGYEEMVKILLKKENIDVNKANKKGNTPLHIALKKRLYYIANSLIAEGKDIDINIANVKGNTPLHIAINGQYVKMIETLLDKGADVNKANFEGNTPLHIAVNISDNITNSLLAKGKNIDINIANNEGKTPLNIAIEKGYDEMINDIYPNGVYPNINCESILKIKEKIEGEKKRTKRTKRISIIKNEGKIIFSAKFKLYNFTITLTNNEFLKNFNEEKDIYEISEGCMYKNGHFFEKNILNSFLNEEEKIKKKLEKDNVLGAIYIFFKYNLIEDVKYIKNFKYFKNFLIKNKFGKFKNEQVKKNFKNFIETNIDQFEKDLINIGFNEDEAAAIEKAVAEKAAAEEAKEAAATAAEAAAAKAAAEAAA